MFSAIEFPETQTGLNEFSRYLTQLDFPHRLSEHHDKVVLWVYQEDHIAIANQLYQRFLLQPHSAITANISTTKSVAQSLSQLIRQYPITLGLIILCGIGFYICIAEKLQWLSLFSFQGFNIVAETYKANTVDVVREQILNGQVWRLITPIFLHFDIMHITFNATILWFCGHQIERKEGHLTFLLYIIFIGAASNIAQYYFSMGNLFGGMSGVNYGLLAYCAYKNFVFKRPVFMLPVGFFIVSVVMMILGFLNVFTLIGYSIANWAHLAGFVSGLLLGIIFNKKERDFMSVER